MATRPYWVSFGASAVSGLAPTFIQFRSTAGSTLAPPAITEPGSFGMYLFNYDPITQVAFIIDGFTTGLAFQDRYVKGVLDPFDQFGVTLVAIGNTQAAYGNSLIALGVSNLALGVSNLALGVSNFALGTSNLALENSAFAQGVSILALGVSSYAIGVSNYAMGLSLNALIGDTTSSFGTDISDPTTVFGFLKRAQEAREGNETYTKATGVLDIYSRGSSQLLREKTISDSTTSTTKT